MAQVVLKNISKNFGAVRVIDSVDLTIASGEFVVFVGPSGSGKSTLLRMIAGLDTATGGAVLIDGQDVTFAEPADRGIAMVFQSYALYPHMNVYENIAFNLRLSRLPRAEIDKRVQDAARILRLEALLQRSPAQLSGGQRQRVAIGRAIVRNPKVFLFDEPLSNLDAALRVKMRLEIERLHRELDATMIYVTHDQVEAMTLADRIVALDGGRVQQVGAPLDLYARPGNRFVAGFIGSPTMNFLPAQVVSAANGAATLRLDADAETTVTLDLSDAVTGQPITLGLRPEGITILPDGKPGLGATIETLERLGNITFAYLNIGAPDLLTVQIMGDQDLTHGQTVRLGLIPGQMHVFNDHGTAMKRGPA